MNESSVSDSGGKSRPKRLLFWAGFASLLAVCAAIGAVLLLRLLLFQQPRSEVAPPADKAGQVSESLPVSTPDAVEPSMELSTAPQSEPPPVPPLPDIYISDLKPLRFLSGWGQSGINQSVIGKPLTIEGETYEHGLGTHANGEAIFDIPADARRFVAVVGLDDEVADDKWDRGSVSFEVYGDVNEIGKPPVLLGQSPVLSSRAVRSWAFNLELGSRFKRIELVVSEGGDGNECDHADWVNAGFLLDHLKIPEIRTEAWNPQTESQWGAPVDGVQARLRAPQTNWNARAIPRLFVDVRNQGQRHLLVQKQMHSCEVEVDGQWFRRPVNTRETRALPSPFPPGRQYDGIVVDLDNYWEPTGEAAKRLGRMVRVKDKLTPGRHTVRVAVTATADQSAPRPPVRAVSNPVEIEMTINL